ncbi:MAG: hypothetical protein NVS2B16_11950 [Chloroflexota bacterium]
MDDERGSDVDTRCHQSEDPVVDSGEALRVWESEGGRLDQHVIIPHEPSRGAAGPLAIVHREGAV